MVHALLPSTKKVRIVRLVFGTPSRANSVSLCQANGSPQVCCISVHSAQVQAILKNVCNCAFQFALGSPWIRLMKVPFDTLIPVQQSGGLNVTESVERPTPLSIEINEHRLILTVDCSITIAFAIHIDFAFQWWLSELLQLLRRIRVLRISISIVQRCSVILCNSW